MKKQFMKNAVKGVSCRRGESKYKRSLLVDFNDLVPEGHRVYVDSYPLTLKIGFDDQACLFSCRLAISGVSISFANGEAISLSVISLHLRTGQGV